MLDSAVGSGATVVVVAMEGETGSFNAGCIDDGVYADVFLVIVIQRHLGGGEEKSQEGCIAVVLSHSRRLFRGDWRMMEERFVLL